MATPSTTATCRHCGADMFLEACSIGYMTVCPACGYAFMEAKNMAIPSSSQSESKAVLYANAGIGPEYQKQDVDCAEILEAVRAGRNVFLYGGNGTGKTTLAASAGMALIDGGVKVKFVNAAAVTERVGVGPDLGYEAFVALKNELCTADVLILDDLGKGNPTELSMSLWYAVTEARNAAMLPTIVTTNYDGGQLIARLAVKGDDSSAKAIVSRLRGGAFAKRMGGADMRLAL